MMDSELKPCPWCGDIPTAADAIADTSQGGKWGSIVCPGCGIVGPEVRTGYGQPVEWAGLAIDAWNARAIEQREAVPVAWANPMAFHVFAERGHLGGVYAREWMWCKPSEGMVPLYTTPPRDVPEGFVPVPREPTEAMVSAMAECYDPTWGYPNASIGKEWAQKSYAAMLAAAPSGEGQCKP